jgi:hypothetical protein
MTEYGSDFNYRISTDGSIDIDFCDWLSNDAKCVQISDFNTLVANEGDYAIGPSSAADELVGANVIVAKGNKFSQTEIFALKAKIDNQAMCHPLITNSETVISIINGVEKVVHNITVDGNKTFISSTDFLSDSIKTSIGG